MPAFTCAPAIAHLLTVALSITTLQTLVPAAVWAQPATPSSQPSSENLSAEDASDLVEQIAVENSAEAIAAPSEFAQVELQETLEEERAIDPLSVPRGRGEIISAIEVRFVDREGAPTQGRTREFIITREFDLRQGDAYDPQRGLEGLRRVVDLTAVRTARLTLEPTHQPNSVVMVITVVEGPNFVFQLGDRFQAPWVAPGITQARPVGALPPRLSGFQIPANLQWRNIGGNDQSLTLSFRGGNQLGAADLTFYAGLLGRCV